MAREPRQIAPGAYVIVDDESDPGTFSFAPRAAQKKVVAAATEHYANILQYIDAEPEQDEWLAALKQIVSLGAVQQQPDPLGAQEQIRKRDKLLKDRLAPFLFPARDRLIVAASVIFAAAVVFGFTLRAMSWGDAHGLDSAAIASYAFAVAGSMPALVIQYLVAIRNVTPTTFAELKSDLSSPAVDALACSIMCVIVVALLASGAVAINIRGLETNGIESNIRTAVIVGIICGLTSRRLGPMLLGLGTKLTSRLK